MEVSISFRTTFNEEEFGTGPGTTLPISSRDATAQAPELGCGFWCVNLGKAKTPVHPHPHTLQSQAQEPLRLCRDL